jgi:pimeloyl-ACP methyl ester carboxylesterase
VVFLHGWALGHRSYKRALKRLVALGCRVHAPALPGFGGTGDLTPASRHFGDYATWVESFVAAARVREPYVLVGHSFGGAVAVASAHRSPETIRQLVLLNSIGGPGWDAGEGSVVRSLQDRTLLEWAIGFPRDLMPFGDLVRTLPSLVEDAVPNVVRSPLSLWRTAEMVRSADMSEELAALRLREMTVKVIGSAGDRVVPAPATAALAEALGAKAETVPGGHCWMLASPDAFGERMARVIAEVKGRVEPDRPSAVSA